MIAPRRLAHRGSIVASGFVVEAAIVGDAEARRRVLALWTPTAAVHAYATGFIVIALTPARVRADAALGTPLALQHGVLAALPLDPDEARAMAAPGAVVVARGGIAESVPLAERVEVADWIDLDELAVAEVAPLAAVPAPIAIPAPPETDVRVVTGVASADPRATELAKALAGSSGSQTPSLRQRFAAWLAARIAPRDATSARAAAASAKQRSWLHRFRERLAERLWRSRLGAVLGRMHAAYLQRMLDLFDRGELDEALKHAIPLGGGEAEARLALAPPRPRASLALSLRPRAASSSIVPVHDTAMALLRGRYRAAAQRLEQAGRVEEAAFVYAELLQDVMAAIALLERHGRYAIAAQLGEARDVAPDVIVRLWLFAGDRERAIDVARRAQAWSAAVAWLERAKDPRAEVLRMLWADHLASIGDYVRAVEVAWPIEASRALVAEWIERGIAVEGTSAARLLVKKLAIAPASVSAIAPALLAILGASEGDSARARVALAEELVKSEPSAALRTFARPALRAVLRDGGPTELVDRLFDFADNAALRADRPAVAKRPARSEVAPFAHAWSAHDAGGLHVYDAAVLPGDRLLLALGELGVRLVGKRGNVTAHFDQPATRLVISDHGTRALALAPRGEVTRIARIDLALRRAAHWCDVEIDGGASTFDGDLWLASHGRDVVAVDTTAPRWRAIWGVAIDPADAQCVIRRDGAWFAVEAHSARDVEHWHYERFTLRVRQHVVHADGDDVVYDRGVVVQIGDLVAARPGDKRAYVARAQPGGENLSAETAGGAAALVRGVPGGRLVTVTDPSGTGERGRLVLDGASAAGARLTREMLVVYDDLGRVIAIDLERGTIRRDLRVA